MPPPALTNGKVAEMTRMVVRRRERSVERMVGRANKVRSIGIVLCRKRNQTCGKKTFNQNTIMTFRYPLYMNGKRTSK